MKNSIARLWSQPVLLLTLATLFWAGNTVAGKVAVGHISPGLLTFSRWSLLSLILPFIFGKQMKVVWPEVRERWVYVIVMGTLGLAAFNLLLYISAHHTTAVNIGILLGSTPIIVLIGAYLIYNTRITSLQIMGAVVGLVGVVTVALRGVPSQLADLVLNEGDLLMAGACLFYAGYILGLKKRPNISGIVLFTFFAIAASLLSALAAFMEWWNGSIIWPDQEGWLVVLYVTIFPSFLAQIFFLRSVDLIGPGRSGVFVNLTPVFSALLAVVLLSEAFQLYHAIALTLVILGLWWTRDPIPGR